MEPYSAPPCGKNMRCRTESSSWKKNMPSFKPKPKPKHFSRKCLIPISTSGSIRKQGVYILSKVSQHGQQYKWIISLGKFQYMDFYLYIFLWWLKRIWCQFVVSAGGVYVAIMPLIHGQFWLTSVVAVRTSCHSRSISKTWLTSVVAMMTSSHSRSISKTWLTSVVEVMTSSCHRHSITLMIWQ